MDTSRSVICTRLRLQAIDALRRARRLPIGPHRNDLRQLAIGLRALEMREKQEEPGVAMMGAGRVPGASDMRPAVNAQAGSAA
jgi:hypothetical protein